MLVGSQDSSIKFSFIGLHFRAKKVASCRFLGCVILFFLIRFVNVNEQLNSKILDYKTRTFCKFMYAVQVDHYNIFRADSGERSTAN